MEGDSVTLRTNLTQIQKDDQILWMLKMNNKNICVAEVYMRYNKSRIYDDIDNGRFRGRLKMDNQTGSLTITHMRITDSGLYQLNIINSGGTLYARFRVIVSRLPVPVIGRNASQNASSESSESGPVRIGITTIAVIIIVVAAVVFILAAFAVITFKCDNQARQEVEETEMKPMNNNNKAHDGDGVSAPSNGVSHECSVPVAGRAMR
ncbi:uncharacterized protein LOC130548500 [Triplophysa rosa]|uniref:uncharacterized protein LOC130548500 n=1 Tax=Triplophysa rosa TaxID=992332 RepID=UPI0025460662|nr:uncharacterized protein LOC130548500 [Triplophysa rosa]